MQETQEQARKRLDKLSKIIQEPRFIDLIDKKTGVISKNSNATVSVPASGFPYALWREWNTDCEINYKSIRWLKMWTDHQKA